jgi:hypothetical protein
MTLEIMDFEEYQKKQATRLQNPPTLDDKIPKENRQQDKVICRGGWYIIPKTILNDRENNIKKPIELSNPLLLGVKMFLADIPYIIKGYYDLDRNNCFKFSKDVQDAATKRGIRCGLVTISFYRSLSGHAIVAFETDYGLKFFEPQSANEEEVIVGRRYSVRLSGISNDDLIIKIEISWNDGTNTIID